jgi:predicted ArsR family transcriptional regulator
MSERVAPEAAGGSADVGLLAAQAEMLASPRRYALFRCIDDSTDGCAVDELAARFGLTRSAVRLQLAKLVSVGLLSSAPMPPSGPGRSRLRYRATPAATAKWRSGSPFEQLSASLAAQGTIGRRTPDNISEVG